MSASNRDRVVRVLATGTIAATGVGLFVPTSARLAAGGPTATLVLAGLGAALSAALVAGAAALYRSDVRTRHAGRVAAWNLLGLALLGGVLALVVASGAARLPAFVAADVLAVSAVAHVLIGVTDVRRIRAGELAANRERLAVLNRVLRHNLRHDTQLLLGYAGRLVEGVTDPALVSAAEGVEERSRRLAAVPEEVKAVQGAIESEPSPVELAPLVESVAADVREARPDASVTVDVPEGLRVAASDHLRTAVAHLVENGVEHHDGNRPRVTVTASAAGGEARVVVADDGPGIPAVERAVVAGERDVSQLTHGSGLGLWVAKWIVETHGGRLAFADADAGGTVTLHLDRA
ncbi:MAG: sensor histidine kinase [Halobacteriaceae archaeon]